jgi:hypothetical protein
MGDAEEPFDDGYTAFEKWEYKQLVYVEEHRKQWIIFRESFYRASEIIIKNLAAGRGFPDIEGTAAVFLFRHRALKSQVEFRHQFEVQVNDRRIRTTESLVSSIEENASRIQHDDAWFQAVKHVFVVGNEETGSSQAR